MQTPAPFEYARATSVEHAIQLLEQLGPEARVIAGGHSLLPMMRLRLALPEHLIDIGELTDLAYIRVEGSELRIGAMTTHAALLDSAVAGEHFAILHDAERVVADPIVRNRGTVGGSLAQADPSEDLSAAFSAIGASVVARGPGGSERVIRVRDFHTGAYETALAANELLCEIRVPIRPGAGSAYEKVERRVGDWAIAAAGACIWLANGTIADVGIGLTAVGAHRFCAPDAEAELRDQEPTDEVLRAAAATAAAATNPQSDQRGPAEYKRHLAGELTFRALRRAVDRARGIS